MALLPDTAATDSARTTGPSRRPSGDRADTPTIVIRPSRGWRSVDAREIWAYRELLAFLVWRDVKVRYKQTALGAAWALLHPVLLMLIFTLLSHLTSGAFRVRGTPYPVFVFCGLVPWTLFAQTLNSASDSLVSNANLVSKVYFPRLILPMAAAGGFIIDFVLALIVLLGLMAFYGVHPTAAIALLPLFALFAVLTALAVGTWLTALNVRYRDVKYAVPFLVQVWFFSSPVFYSSTNLIPQHWRFVYGLNPMAGVVEGFRWALLGLDTRPGPEIFVSLAVMVALLVGGVLHFQRVERSFADVI